MAECVEFREDQNLRQVEGSRGNWSGGAEAMQDLVELLAEEHEVGGRSSFQCKCPIGCGNVFSILLLSRHRILGIVHRLKTF